MVAWGLNKFTRLHITSEHSFACMLITILLSMLIINIRICKLLKMIMSITVMKMFAKYLHLQKITDTETQSTLQTHMINK